jgi:hypothetical protein
VTAVDEIRLIRPQFYPKQFAAIFDEHRISVIEASTKSGKTSGCIAWLVEQALKGKPGWNYWWVAPVSDQASIAFRRMMRSVPRDSYIASMSHPQHITLINGAVIWFKSGDKPNSLYGEDVYAAVVDEASRMKEDAWIALRSTLTYTRGPIRIIGNVKGRKNWAYQLARKAQKDQLAGVESEMAYHKITAPDAVAAGVLAEAEIEEARTQMPELAWRELYLAEASDDGGNPFGLSHIEACLRPMSDKPPRWWGWDFAKSHDYTVGIALDADGQVCRFIRFHGVPWGETRSRVVAETGRTPALGDSTGVGDPIVEGLARELGESFQGYHFSAQSKQKLMEGLAVAIQSRTVWYPEGVISHELEDFEYQFTQGGVKYAAAAGCYDDCVCALALAVMCRTVVPTPVVVTADLLNRLRAMPPRRRY